MSNPYHDKKVLITGGLGFIGSNLARTLVREGARVTLIDNLSPGAAATSSMSPGSSASSGSSSATPRTPRC
jgi:nucleoside-diphosphate-sugar epimerase